ncbi:hypothetical protein FB561_2034 [Kribbella amoyensis]|uniref:Uncharacterized protein n=1 Tax=Kribbella amoyensis TaxID=996641 RepID=A0A561BPZ4_9ACTN|nr:hypothetical protein [Kribbella amoyensis]TWD80936.1 hypothetical protein FB561_2034 [Kribbella amoyensis]
MNDEEIQTALRSTPADTDPLDPAKVIAGAHRRKRIRIVTTGAIASAAVVAVAAVTVATAGTSSPPPEPAIAGTPSTSPSTPVQSSRYQFQNEEPPVGTVPRDGETKIGQYTSVATKGEEWAVIVREPGQPAYEPFGWRRTMGNENLGDPTTPGLQSVGAIYTSVFRSPTATTVIYVDGTKAWYGKVNRLAGIPGWVQASVQLDAHPTTKPGALPPNVSVFAYDRTGKLVGRFGSAPDPLHS